MRFFGGCRGIQFDEQRFDNVNAQVVSFLQETQNARSYLTVERSHRDSMNGFLSNSFESHHPTQEAAKEAFKALIQTEHPDEDITNWEKWWDVEQNDKGEWGPIPSLQWFKENFSFLKNPSVYDSTEYNSWVEGLLNINRQFQYPINLKIPYKKLLEIGLRWAEKEKEKIYITVRTISTSTYGIEQKASRDSLKPSNIKGATLLDIKQSLQNTQLLSPEEIQDIVNGYFNVLINPSESFFPALMTVPVEIINPKTTTINQEEGKSPEVSDPASKTERYGGIDLNAVNLNLQIKRDGNGFLMPITIEDLASFQIDGLVPEIISIEPATYLPFLNTILE